MISSNFQDIQFIAGVITILTALITALFKLNKWIRSRNKTTENFEMNLIKVLACSYLLLQMDYIYKVGAWGKSIGKYALLNFPDLRKDKIDEYKKTGSITHTFHALLGLEKVRNLGFSSYLDIEQVEDYLRKMRHENGVFHPTVDHIVNRDEIGTITHFLRHNANAINVLFYLKEVRNKNIYDEWIQKASKNILLYPETEMFEYNDRFAHSLAYLLFSLNMLLNKGLLSPDENIVLETYLERGFNTLISRNSNGFWTGESHPNTKCFYTLLILELCLLSGSFIRKEQNIEFSIKIIRQLRKFRNKDNGLSLSCAKDNTKFSKSDIGTTSRYFNCICTILKNINNDDTKEELIELKNESLSFIVDNFLSLNAGNYNSITHTYAGILNMIPHIKDLNHAELIRYLIDIDGNIDNLIRNPKQIRILQNNELPLKFLHKMVTRDFINSPNKFLKIIGFNYWY